jgi:hypothetical protein
MIPSLMDLKSISENKLLELHQIVCLRSAVVVTASQFRHIDMHVNCKH